MERVCARANGGEARPFALPLLFIAYCTQAALEGQVADTGDRQVDVRRWLETSSPSTWVLASPESGGPRLRSLPTFSPRELGLDLEEKLAEVGCGGYRDHPLLG